MVESRDVMAVARIKSLNELGRSPVDRNHDIARVQARWHRPADRHRPGRGDPGRTPPIFAGSVFSRA